MPYFEDIAIEHEGGDHARGALHDGSRIVLHKLDRDYDPTDRSGAMRVLARDRVSRRYATGLLYIDAAKRDFCSLMNLVDQPLSMLPASITRPPASVLDELMERQR